MVLRPGAILFSALAWPPFGSILGSVLRAA